MKRYVQLFLLCLAAVLTMSSCAKQYSEIKLSSFSVKSFVPNGTRAGDLVASIGVDNPAGDFTVESLDCLVKVSGSGICTLTASGLHVDGKTDKVYEVPLHGELSENVSWLSILGKLRALGKDAVKVDVSAKVKLRGGFGKTIEYKDVSLDQLTGLF